jgi:hypothetical protein
LILGTLLLVDIVILLIFCLFRLPVVTKRASGTCIDHILNKFPEKMVCFGPHFSSALSDLCFLSFSYCVGTLLPVDQVVSFMQIC